MKINTHIRAKNITLTPETENHIDKKKSAFLKYIDSKDSSADLYVELQKTTEHHKSGEIFRTEFNLHIAGKELRSEAEASDLQTSIEIAKDEMVEKLRAEKDKDTTIFKKGARRIKDMIHGLYRPRI